MFNKFFNSSFSKNVFNKLSFFKSSFFKISFLIFVFSFFINTNITKADTIITDSLGEDAILTINNSDNECELPSINISKSSVSKNSAENDNREYFTAWTTSSSITNYSQVEDVSITPGSGTYYFKWWVRKNDTSGFLAQGAIVEINSPITIPASCDVIINPSSNTAPNLYVR